ncbi:PIN domain-containing protein [Sphingomonas sp. Leaf4]|uniref:PIN domain-containing protein n=1 Tax=Sphingomonas sp. Leaf4 TaxID=2876553 RepID=UPI001E39AA4C|nr:PIN domain-containing protein [Sphingomonas sp. Leaf4]
MSVVLDASALLALLRGEAGAKKVEGALAGARMSVVSMAEVASHYHKIGMPDDAVDRMLRSLPITLVPADAALARDAARLSAQALEGGLSLGERFCLALARRDALPAWTADRTWKEIAAAAEVKVVAIR